MHYGLMTKLENILLFQHFFFNFAQLSAINSLTFIMIAHCSNIFHHIFKLYQIHSVTYATSVSP